MSKTRLEAFSDGVIAILITIMVLELRTPHGTTWAALREDLPVLLAYVLSFVFIGIYWNNHHHMLAAVSRVSGMALWVNQHLLFWLSLIPAATAWMSENHFRPIPVAAYCIVLLAASLAYYTLQAALLRNHVAGYSDVGGVSRRQMSDSLSGPQNRRPYRGALHVQPLRRRHHDRYDPGQASP